MKTGWVRAFRCVVATLSVVVLVASCGGGDSSGDGGGKDAQGKQSDTSKEQDDRSGRQGATLTRDTKGKAEIAKNDPDDDLDSEFHTVTDSDEIAENWGVSAATFIATSRPDTDLTTGNFQALLDQNAYPDDCTDKGVVEYHDHGYSGLLQRWNECGESDTIWLVLAATSDDGSHGVLLTIAGTIEDQEALPTVLGSFRVVAPTPLDV